MASLGLKRGLKHAPSSSHPQPEAMGWNNPAGAPTPLRHPEWSPFTPADLSVPLGGAGLGGQIPAHRGEMGLIHPPPHLPQEAPSPVRASSLLVTHTPQHSLSVLLTLPSLDRSPGAGFLPSRQNWLSCQHPPTSASFSVPKSQLLTSVLFPSASDGVQEPKESSFLLPP